MIRSRMPLSLFPSAIPMRCTCSIGLSAISALPAMYAPCHRPADGYYPHLAILRRELEKDNEG
jgi:hypothetical protein